MTDVQGRVDQRHYRRDQQGGLAEVLADGRLVFPDQSILLAQPTSTSSPQFPTSLGANQAVSGSVNQPVLPVQPVQPVLPVQPVYPSQSVIASRPTSGSVIAPVVCTSNLQRQ